jgi:hypothetical protein
LGKKAPEREPVRSLSEKKAPEREPVRSFFGKKAPEKEPLELFGKKCSGKGAFPEQMRAVQQREASEERVKGLMPKGQ